MNTFFLLLTILALSMQSILQKQYNTIGKNLSVFGFNALSAAAAFLFFALLSGGSFTLHTPTLVYAVFFGIAYLTTMVSCVLSIRYGSLSLFSLAISYSLLLPTLYGILFLREPAKPSLYIGLALFLLSILLINFNKNDKKISVKWVVFTLLAFFGNGLCTILQKQQQLEAGGAYKSEFMMTALLLAALGSLILTLCFENKRFRPSVRKGWHLAALCGLCNGSVNLLVMTLCTTMPASLLFPLVSAGGIVTTFFVSRFVYKETLSRTQLLGFCIGVGSIIALNI